MKKKHYIPWLSRIVRRDIKINVIRHGVSPLNWGDLYHWLLTISWSQFVALTAFLYTTTNTLFALLYLVGGDCIQNARRGSFLDVFFFSVQTLATIGYGAMYPRTTYANIVVSVEVLVGIVGVAIVTGLSFARFSLPRAKVLFSKVAVVTLFNGLPTLMFRVANERDNLIVEARIWVSLIRNEITTEGHQMRRFHDLNLVRKQTPAFALTWTVIHQIDEHSPLYGATTQTLVDEEIELVVTLTGLDETVSQTIHARHSFAAHNIFWNMRFVDIFAKTPDGQRCIDYTRFHDVTPAGLT